MDMKENCELIERGSEKFFERKFLCEIANGEKEQANMS
jgi:hypothetical protein